MAGATERPLVVSAGPTAVAESALAMAVAQAAAARSCLRTRYSHSASCSGLRITGWRSRAGRISSFAPVVRIQQFASSPLSGGIRRCPRLAKANGSLSRRVNRIGARTFGASPLIDVRHGAGVAPPAGACDGRAVGDTPNGSTTTKGRELSRTLPSTSAAGDGWTRRPGKRTAMRNSAAQNQGAARTRGCGISESRRSTYPPEGCVLGRRLWHGTPRPVLGTVQSDDLRRGQTPKTDARQRRQEGAVAAHEIRRCTRHGGGHDGGVLFGDLAREPLDLFTGRIRENLRPGPGCSQTWC